MEGVLTFFFPNRKNYLTLTKINFIIVFLTIKSLGINFENSQYLLICHLKKFLQKIRRNTNTSRKIKFVGEMNLTIRFFTPKNLGINLNIIKYLSLWPPKKFMKKIDFFFKFVPRPPIATVFWLRNPSGMSSQHPRCRATNIWGSHVKPPKEISIYQNSIIVWCEKKYQYIKSP